MLFNSYIFIFAFFPIIFLVFFQIGKTSHALASFWLAAASLFFYGWWDIRYVALLLASIAFNYAAGYVIGHRVARGRSGSQQSIIGRPDFNPTQSVSQSVKNLAGLGNWRQFNSAGLFQIC